MLPRLPAGVADEVIAVDGGSTDGTTEILQEHGISVVRQRSRGRGEAFRIAVARTSADCIVFFSPDGNENPEDIARLFTALDEGADMVIASRFLPGSVNEEDEAALPFRKWANLCFNRVANALWNQGSYVTDTINGFRGIRRQAFLDLAPRSVGFTIEYELSILAMKSGMRIVEIPTVEGQRLGGETKAPSLRTGLAFVRYLVAEILGN